MRRVLGVLLAACALVVGLVGPASAASTTVAGTGDINKMQVSNGQKALVVKIYGAGGKNVARWVNFTVRGRDGKEYRAQGGWIGADWITSLERGARVVQCGNLSLRYNGTGRFWQFSVPRTCLGQLTNTVKVVSAELVLTTSATGGMAGPTRWVPRG